MVADQGGYVMPVSKKVSSGAAELHRKAEEKTALLSAEEEACLSELDAKRLLHELRVHQVELEMQNDELCLKQNELEALRERYFTLYDLAPVGYLTLGSNGLIQEANLAAATMLGVERKSLIKTTISKFIPPEDQNIYYQNLNQLNDGSESHAWHMRLLHADGVPFWAHIQAISGRNVESWFTFNDVTEQKLAEAALLDAHLCLEQRVTERTRELSDAHDKLKQEIEEHRLTGLELKKRQNFLQTVLQTTQEGFWVVDMQGRFSDVNEAYCKMSGYTRDELLGMTIQDVEALEDEADTARRVKEVTAKGKVQFETKHRRKDGRIIDLDVSANLMPDESKIFTFLHDTSELRMIEADLREANQKLELRVMERTSALELANEQMKKISFEMIWAEERERERIAGELHDQVGQSLLLAKIKLNKLSASTKSKTFRNFAEETLPLIENSISEIRSLTFRMRPPILDTAGIETSLRWLCSSITNDYDLQMDFDGDCQSELPKEFRYSLYQVVRELLLNILKHAKTDRGLLRIKTENQTFIVQVLDNGVGFNPSDSTIKHCSEGYGLYNVQQRIEYLGGKIVVESTLGSGTSVTLMVPLNVESFFLGGGG